MEPKEPKNWSRCTNSSQSRLVVAKEKGKEFRINNHSKYKIEKTKVDKCLIKDESVIKCDFLFVIHAPDKLVYYVELKGTDIAHGCEQLIATYDFCKGELRNYIGNHKSSFYIIASRVPQMTPKIQNFKKKMRSKGIALQFKSKKIEIEV